MANRISENVLVYRAGRRSQKTIRKYFLEWRYRQIPSLPLRCDIPECCFHKGPLEWNGKELKLILDHINGVCGDNRPENLKFLCPNCNSQQLNHGGANKGKTEQHEGGFALINTDGKRNYALPAEPGHFKITGYDINSKTSND